jgi:pyruvate dehydrogenase E1 component beta subunit
VNEWSIELVSESVSKTNRLVVADVTWGSFGLLGEVLRRLGLEKQALPAKVAEVVPEPVPCPTAKELEDMYYPSISDFVKILCDISEYSVSEEELPKEKSFRDFYLKFKGPF